MPEEAQTSGRALLRTPPHLEADTPPSEGSGASSSEPKNSEALEEEKIVRAPAPRYSKNGPNERKSAPYSPFATIN